MQAGDQKLTIDLEWPYQYHPYCYGSEWLYFCTVLQGKRANFLIFSLNAYKMGSIQY